MISLLKIVKTPAELDYGQVMHIYGESLLRSAKTDYPYLDGNQQLIEAEQDFYLFLKSFLKQKDSLCFFWISKGRYVSALRIEPFQDGYLIEGVETAEDFRNQGFAKCLLNAALEYMQDQGIDKIYSHIHRANTPSMSLHLSCGFVKIKDCAAYVDGSVDHKSGTYLFVKKL